MNFTTDLTYFYLENYQIKFINKLDNQYILKSITSSKLLCTELS